MSLEGAVNDALRRPKRRVRRSFMKPSEFRKIRESVLHATQETICAQIIHPGTGAPITQGTLSRWEAGTRAVPLWAARRIRSLAGYKH
jgi:hypothetical protein